MATVDQTLLNSLKAQLGALIDGTSPEITSTELTRLLNERVRLAQYIKDHERFLAENIATVNQSSTPGTRGNVEIEQERLRIAREADRLNELAIISEKKKITDVLIPLKQAQVDAEQDKVIELAKELAKTDPEAQAQLIKLEQEKAATASLLGKIATRKTIIWGVVIIVVIIAAIWAWRKFRKK